MIILDFSPCQFLPGAPIQFARKSGAWAGRLPAVRGSPPELVRRCHARLPHCVAEGESRDAVFDSHWARSTTASIDRLIMLQFAGTSRRTGAAAASAPVESSLAGLLLHRPTRSRLRGRASTRRWNREWVARSRASVGIGGLARSRDTPQPRWAGLRGGATARRVGCRLACSRSRAIVDDVLTNPRRMLWRRSQCAGRRRLIGLGVATHGAAPVNASRMVAVVLFRPEIPPTRQRDPPLRQRCSRLHLSSRSGLHDDRHSSAPARLHECDVRCIAIGVGLRALAASAFLLSTPARPLCRVRYGAEAPYYSGRDACDPRRCSPFPRRTLRLPMRPVNLSLTFERSRWCVRGWRQRGSPETCAQ